MGRPGFALLFLFAACASQPVTEEELDPWIGTYRLGGREVRIERTGPGEYRLTDPRYAHVVFRRNAGGWLEDRPNELGRILPSVADAKADPPRPYQLLQAHFRCDSFTLVRK